MPTYEYKCAKGHVFEALQKMSDEPLTACTKCGAPVQRVFHPVAVHFKGKGFYNTDYGTKRRARELEKSGSEGGEGGKGEGKADAKADGKADAKDKPKEKASPPAKSSSDKKA